MTKANLDLAFVRSQFPALNDQCIYMENAGGSQILKPVIDRVTEFYTTSNVQPGFGYEVSQLAASRMRAGHEAMASFVNAASPDELVLGYSTSMLVKLLSLSLMENYRAGDEIVLSSTGHEANIGPWLDLEKRGLVIKWWRPNPATLEHDLKGLEALMSERTRLVAMPHVSNVLGTINPIAGIAEIVHRFGAQFCVDGVAYAPHRAIDVRAWDVDFYLFSFYKVYGSHHAMLYVKKHILDQLPSVNFYFIKKGAYKLQPGGLAFELVYGMTGIRDYFQALAAHHFPSETFSDRQAVERGFELIAAHEEALSRRLLDYLNGKSKVRVIGSPDPSRAKRVTTISFIAEDVPNQTIVDALHANGIGAACDDFYAKRLVDELDLVKRGGVVRIGMVHYNTLEEVERLISVLDQVL